jgi:tRNA(Ile)-lysidine synthase
VRRAALRDWMAAEDVAWAEDPSNADTRFDRVRARAALEPLAGLGIGSERLAATAAAMGRARAALEEATAALARECLQPGSAGDLALDPAALCDAPEEVRLRLLAGSLCWVSGAAYRPRLARLEAAAAVVSGGLVGHGLTLHGCVLRQRGGRISIRREPGRVAPPVPLAAGRWDGRWEVAGPAADEGLSIAALGAAGLMACPDWRTAGLVREALLTTPAVWRGDALVAAPVLRPGAGYRFRRISAVPAPWELPIVR